MSMASRGKDGKRQGIMEFDEKPRGRLPPPTRLIIPAAGLGTRMKGVNPSLPKEMLPVGGKPAIQYALEEGLDAGMDRIVIIIREEKEIIRTYVESARLRRDLPPERAAALEALKSRAGITFLYQRSPLGECDAILLARDAAAEGSVAIIYPDNIYLPAPGVLRALLAHHGRTDGHLLALMEVGDDNKHCVSNSGRVDLEPVGGGLYRIRGFLPKGDGCFEPRYEREYRACGISIAAAEYLRAIEEMGRSSGTGEIVDERVRSAMLKKGTAFYGCPLPGKIYDVGNPAGYGLCRSVVLSQE
jgi:UTP--glucose-1-phosphate uridylyltransferase